MKTDLFLYKNLKYLIGKKKYLRKELLNELNVSAETLTTILTKQKGISIDSAFVIATNLNVDPISFLFKDLSIIESSKRIKFLVLDIDGVLTDGGMYYTEKGDEFKKFNTKDGLLIRRLARKGLKVGFLSNGVSKKLVQNRAKLLEVEKVYVGTEEKSIILKSWAKELKIKMEEIAYIGDDLNDSQIFDMVGFSACPADACIEIKQKADYILQLGGGEGCVREFIDKFMSELI